MPDVGFETDPRLLLLSPQDNVLVLREAISSGEQILINGVRISIPAHIGIGHKLAGAAIPSGNKVLKYGAPIGSVTSNIAIGDHVHVHNMKSDYTPTYVLDD
jgi:altronate dehydratase small subunit